MLTQHTPDAEGRYWYHVFFRWANGEASCALWLNVPIQYDSDIAHVRDVLAARALKGNVRRERIVVVSWLPLLGEKRPGKDFTE